MNITCAHCFTTNRIPQDRDHQLAKCGKCKSTLYSSSPINLDDHNFFPFIERNDLPIVVDFWADWCGPCKMMAPVFSKVAQTTPSILFAKVDTQQVPQIAANANIRSIPTLIYFHQGREIDRVSGALNEMQFKQWIVQTIQKTPSSSS